MAVKMLDKRSIKVSTTKPKSVNNSSTLDTVLTERDANFHIEMSKISLTSDKSSEGLIFLINKYLIS